MKKKIILFIGILFLIAACDPSDFDDTNVDPTRVTEAPNSTLLTFALQQLPYTVFNSPTRQTATNGLGTTQMLLYAQYLSEGPYPGSSLYTDRNIAWGAWFNGPLYNLQTIINNVDANSSLANALSNGSLDNQKAVARILKAYYFWTLTDRYGDMPYSEALKGNEILQPKYDTQQDIYTDLFKELTEAQASIKLEEAGPAGDILLGGDMALWKKFANTTRLFMSLRLIKVDLAKAQAEFNAAMTDGVLAEGEDITYQFLGGDPQNWNPWYENYTNDNRNDYAISNTLADYMLANNDPRIYVYGENLGGQVKSLSFGSSAARNIPGAYSRLGDALRAAGTSAPIYTYAQVLFVQAEAANRGLMAGGDVVAATLYNQAIDASWAFWLGEADPATLAAFKVDPDVVYLPGTAGLEKIITQKWVHQFMNGFEAWTDYRRTGYPALTPAEDAVDPRGIPRRWSYPSNALTLNEASYNAAIARQGADDNYTRIWWDVE